MFRPFADPDAHLFLIPIALLAAALGVCALLLVLHLLAAPPASGIAVDEAPAAASLPACA